jgi:predicted branched-subunit amino acid permease
MAGSNEEDRKKAKAKKEAGRKLFRRALYSTLRIVLTSFIVALAFGIVVYLQAPIATGMTNLGVSDPNLIAIYTCLIYFGIATLAGVLLVPISNREEQNK